MNICFTIVFLFFNLIFSIIIDISISELEDYAMYNVIVVMCVSYAGSVFLFLRNLRHDAQPRDSDSVNSLTVCLYLERKFVFGLCFLCKVKTLITWGRISTYGRRLIAGQVFETTSLKY